MIKFVVDGFFFCLYLWLFVVRNCGDNFIYWFNVWLLWVFDVCRVNYGGDEIYSWKIFYYLYVRKKRGFWIEIYGDINWLSNWYF